MILSLPVDIPYRLLVRCFGIRHHVSGSMVSLRLVMVNRFSPETKMRRFCSISLFIHTLGKYSQPVCFSDACRLHSADSGSGFCCFCIKNRSWVIGIQILSQWIFGCTEVVKMLFERGRPPFTVRYTPESHVFIARPPVALQYALPEHL